MSNAGEDSDPYKQGFGAISLIEAFLESRINQILAIAGIVGLCIFLYAPNFQGVLQYPAQESVLWIPASWALINIVSMVVEPLYGLYLSYRDFTPVERRWTSPYYTIPHAAFCGFRALILLTAVPLILYGTVIGIELPSKVISIVQTSLSGIFVLLIGAGGAALAINRLKSASQSSSFSGKELGEGDYQTKLLGVCFIGVGIALSTIIGNLTTTIPALFGLLVFVFVFLPLAFGPVNEKIVGMINSRTESESASATEK